MPNRLISMRWPEGDITLIDRAAEKLGKKRTQFVLSVLRSASQDVLEHPSNGHSNVIPINGVDLEADVGRNNPVRRSPRVSVEVLGDEECPLHPEGRPPLLFHPQMKSENGKWTCGRCGERGRHG